MTSTHALPLSLISAPLSYPILSPFRTRVGPREGREWGCRAWIRGSFSGTRDVRRQEKSSAWLDGWPMPKDDDALRLDAAYR